MAGTENSEQFKEVHKVKNYTVRLLSDTGMSGLLDKKVRVHMHSPATEALGQPIFSVLHQGRVQGQTDNIVLSDAQMRVDKRQLEKFLANPSGGKTRNTFVEGIVSPEPPRSTRGLRIRPGSMTDEKTGEDVSTGMSAVHLGPRGARYRR